MTNYYVIVHGKTGRLLVSSSRLPIYWVKRVAKQTADRWPGYVVAKIGSDNLQSVIQDFERHEEDKMVKFCTSVCKLWDVSFEWVINGRRTNQRPMMKKILYLILVKHFPGVTLKKLASVMGHKDHAGPLHSMRRAKNWISVSDPVIMKYYEPVKHLLNG